ncbi:MAG: hypothetical protein GC158_02830 [Cyanobacteria bacterium RI_101]|nr:hypothetical protein [Cyanobacteria bacterium RI_101]
MAIASTILAVTTTLDQNNGNLADGLSLREAILIANANPDTPYTIQLQGGLTYNLTFNGTRENKGQRGDLDLLPRSQPVRIEALGGGQATINGATLTERDRVLDVKGAHLILDGVVITGGYITDLPKADYAQGGGARVRQGTLEVYDSGIIDNYADNDGGGLFAQFSEVYIAESLIKGNVTGGKFSDGGGISNTTGTMTIVNSTLSENEVGFGGGTVGGAIHNFGGVKPGETSYLVVLNSTLNNNRGLGAAISNDSNASSLVVNTTISGNTGLAVFIDAGTHEFINATITQNSQQSGSNSTAGVRHRDIKGGTVTLRNTIVAGNTNASGNAWGSNLAGAFVGNGNNLIGDLLGTTGTIGTGTDIIAANPLLGPLQDNGGPTRTRAPLPGSLAIDGGNNAFLPNDTFDLDGDGNTAEKLPLDQRGLGFNRVAGLRVDIGAVETPPLTVSKPEFLGTSGADMLRGSKQADVLIGLGGDDTYFVNNPGDEIIELPNQGLDTIKSNISFTLPNQVENLVFFGSSDLDGAGNDLNNRLTGNTGDNVLQGGAGDDTLLGKLGRDTLVGGLGNDTLDLGVNDGVPDIVLYALGNGTDTAQGFVKGIDRLAFTGVAFIDVVAGAKDTQLRLGNGSAPGFGDGELLMTLRNVTGLTPSELGPGGSSVDPFNTAQFFFA